MKKWAFNGVDEEKSYTTHYRKVALQVWQELIQKQEFSFPAPLLQSGAYAATINKQKKRNVYLFGFSMLPQMIHKFFIDLAAIYEMKSYILSPCMMFWSDIVSDRQVQVEKNELLSELLLDRNSLLANNGKAGREFARLLEESTPHAKQEYRIAKNVKMMPEFSDFIRPEAIEQKESKKKTTLLEYVQTDLLLLCGKRENKISIPKEDRSIEIHSVQTYYREIQLLYERLVAITESEKEESLSPCDIIVLAPDIERYIPYIERVFSVASNPLSYQIIDKSSPCHTNALLETFFHLLDFA